MELNSWKYSANLKLCHKRLQLLKSCFIALLFFYAGKVYCSIILLPALTSVSIYWTRSFSHGPRSFADCRLHWMYLMVCCALLYYCVAVWLLLFLSSHCGFHLSFGTHNNHNILIDAFISQLPLASKAILSAFIHTQSTLPSAQSFVHQRDVIQSR